MVRGLFLLVGLLMLVSLALRTFPRATLIGLVVVLFYLTRYPA